LTVKGLLHSLPVVEAIRPREWRRLLEGERETQSFFIISHLEFQGKRSRTLIRK